MQQIIGIRRLVAEIGVVEFGVVAALAEEGLVVAFFDDPAFLEDQDTVDGADGGEAVGDQDGGGAFQD